MAKKKEQTAEQKAKMEAALNQAFPNREQNQPVDPESVQDEKPKRKVHRKTEEEKAEASAKAKAKREKAREKRDSKKREDFLAQLEAHWALEREKLKEERERAFRKFTCPELIRIFGGWFTLTYAFSTQNAKGINTDYYICSQDVNHLNVNERPALNKVIQNAYGKDVYGFAIIAPASAFGEGGAEL